MGKGSEGLGIIGGEVKMAAGSGTEAEAMGGNVGLSAVCSVGGLGWTSRRAVSCWRRCTWS